MNEKDQAQQQHNPGDIKKGSEFALDNTVPMSTSEDKMSGTQDQGEQAVITTPQEQKQEEQEEGNNNDGNDAQPQHPYSVFLQWEKYTIVIAVSCLAFFSSISVPIYLPALPELETKFNVSTELINLTVVIYTLFQGLAPSFWSPLADEFGRRPVYLACCIVYIGACVGLALARNYGMLMGFRALQAMGMASTVAIGSGVCGDLTQRKDRGRYVALFSGITLIGSAVGPLIGAGLTNSFGWRAVFWFLVIAAGACFVFVIVAIPETCRSIVGNGSVKPRRALNQAPIMILRGMLQDKFKQISFDQGKAYGIIEPHKKVSKLATWVLMTKLNVILILVPCGLHYATWLMLITSQSTLFTDKYHFTVVHVGLSYLGSGLGSILGSLVSGRILDAVYRRQVRKYEEAWRQEHGESEPVDMTGFDIFKARLSTFPYPSALLLAATIIFGWTIEYHVHWSVPVVMMFFVSSAVIYFLNIAGCLLVDLYPRESSSATAALNLVRCVLAAAGIAAVDKMTTSLGPGGAFTLLSGINLASWALLFLVIRNGQKWDRKRRARQEK